MIFFTYFGLFTFIGLIIISFLTSRELKKQLPTEAEKQMMVSIGLISSGEKNKKVLRHQTSIFRTVNVAFLYMREYPKLEIVIKNSKPYNVLAEDKVVNL